MYNLIIVDDETLIRNSLVRTVDWESLGVHMAAALNDGEEAVRYMKEHPVDLVLSDIRMPFMDGIELLNYISVNYPSTRVILLTGYAEFDYVKQAMRSRVFDYLLKPLKQEELEETVLRCLESIKEENRIQKLVVQKSRENRQECLRRCLLGVGSGEEKEDLFAGADGYGLIVLIYDFSEQLSGQERACMDQVEQFLAGNVMTRQMELEKLQLIFVRMQPNKQCVMLLPEETDQPVSVMPVRRLAAMLHEYLMKNGGPTVTICYKACAGRDKTAQYYQEMLQTLDRRHILGNNRILESSGEMKEEEDISVITYPSEEILDHIRYGQAELVEEDIRKIYDSILDGTVYASLTAARNLSIELAITIFRLQQSGSEQVSFLFFLSELQRLKTVEELRDKILELALTMARENVGKFQRPQVVLAEEALECIRQNYGNPDLGLEMISDRLGVSATYLSVVLKKVTGSNFSVHLLGERMNRAKELLREDHKLQEVAEMVGYSSSQYFSVCFKKYTGMTPSQFREVANGGR